MISDEADRDDGLRALSASAVHTAQWIWRDGELVPWAEATVHVTAVGHSSVAAVFEGIKAYRAADEPGVAVFRLAEHIDRMFDSARICRLTIPYSAEQLRQAVLDVLEANGCDDDTYIRPWAFPRGLIREQMVPDGADCTVVIDTWPFVSHLFEQRACRAMVSSWARPGDNSVPPRAKAFSNYHNGRLALIEARTNGHDWPILLNHAGRVAEGPGACVLLVRDGTVVTPSLTSGVLESITRSTLLTLLREAGVSVCEREVDRTELYLADELFFVGTAWELLPVGWIDGLRIGDGDAGPIVRRLERAYDALVRSSGSGDHADWLTRVPR